MTCETCLGLLNEALNLAVRARNMDAIDRRASTLAASDAYVEWQASGRFDRYVERYNTDPDNAHRPIDTQCVSIQLWVQDQYEKDLFSWEGRARDHLTQGEHTPKANPHD